MSRSKMLMTSAIAILLAAPAAAQDAGMAANGDAPQVPDRAADIIQLQLQSAATMPPPPPMSGVEAGLIYRSYLSRIGKKGGSSDTSSYAGAAAPSAIPVTPSQATPGQATP